MKTAIPVLGYLILFGFYQLPEYVLNQTGNIGSFLALMALVVLIAHWVLRWQGESGLSALGLTITSYSGMQLLAGLVIQGVVSMLAFEGSYGLGITRVTYMPALPELILNSFIFAIGTFLPSLAEDILTRGYLYRYWGQRVSPRIFVIGSTILYVLNHIYRLQNGPATWFFLTVVGISLAIPLAISRSLWLTLGLHWSNNFVYRLTNDVLHTDDVSGISSTWLLTGLILVMSILLPRLMEYLRLTDRPTPKYSTKRSRHSRLVLV